MRSTISISAISLAAFTAVSAMPLPRAAVVAPTSTPPAATIVGAKQTAPPTFEGLSDPIDLGIVWIENASLGARALVAKLRGITDEKKKQIIRDELDELTPEQEKFMIFLVTGNANPDDKLITGKGTLHPTILAKFEKLKLADQLFKVTLMLGLQMTPDQQAELEQLLQSPVPADGEIMVKPAKGVVPGDDAPSPVDEDKEVAPAVKPVGTTHIYTVTPGVETGVVPPPTTATENSPTSESSDDDTLEDDTATPGDEVAQAKEGKAIIDAATTSEAAKDIIEILEENKVPNEAIHQVMEAMPFCNGNMATCEAFLSVPPPAPATAKAEKPKTKRSASASDEIARIIKAEDLTVPANLEKLSKLITPEEIAQGKTIMASVTTVERATAMAEELKRGGVQQGLAEYMLAEMPYCKNGGASADCPGLVARVFTGKQKRGETGLGLGLDELD